MVRRWGEAVLFQAGTDAGNATTAGGQVEGPTWLPAPLGGLLGEMPVWLANLFQAVAVLVIAYAVSNLLVQLLGRRLARRFRRPSLTRTALRGVKVGVYVFAFLTILGIYDYGLGNIVLSVTVFTAVVGVVLAPIVGSVISGMFLLADQPYEIGDMIELADTQQRGFVEDITLRYTKIFTLDNTFLVIPNGTMRERDVMNYSAEDTRTRQSLDVLVTYESEIQRARDLIEQAARGVDGIVEGGPQIRVGAARYPAGPTCYIENFGDHGVLLRLRYWVQEPYWLLRLRSRIQTSVWDAIEDEDIEIAYPHQHQVFDETSGTMQVAFSEDGPDRTRPQGSGPEARSERSREQPDEARNERSSGRTDGDGQVDARRDDE